MCACTDTWHWRACTDMHTHTSACTNSWSVMQAGPHLDVSSSQLSLQSAGCRPCYFRICHSNDHETDHLGGYGDNWYAHGWRSRLYIIHCQTDTCITLQEVVQTVGLQQRPSFTFYNNPVWSSTLLQAMATQQTPRPDEHISHGYIWHFGQTPQGHQWMSEGAIFANECTFWTPEQMRGRSPRQQKAGVSSLTRHPVMRANYKVSSQIRHCASCIHTHAAHTIPCNILTLTLKSISTPNYTSILFNIHVQIAHTRTKHTPEGHFSCGATHLKKLNPCSAI